ncbi:MAG TPA: DUF1016 N-terminal domain-containing protein, partial [Desulfotignum sp.]|nr:DUF1016 N-terminal domain-containing protein [Desulfotignum sp.]
MTDKDRKFIGRARQEAGFPAPVGKGELPADYAAVLEGLKKRIQSERLRVVLSASAAMILLYWDIGRIILERQEQQGWGARVIDRLSHDLKQAFPDMKGLSPRNLLFMRSFAAAYPEAEIVKQVVSKIPWGHNIRILQKVKHPENRLWYIRQTMAHGWSRNILTMQIASRAHQRQGRTTHNFDLTLPPSDSDMAAQVFKDPYLFDFLGTAEPRNER